MKTWTESFAASGNRLMAVWKNRLMAVWKNRLMAAWKNRLMAAWKNRLMAAWKNRLMAAWKNRLMAAWKNRLMAAWKNREQLEDGSHDFQFIDLSPRLPNRRFSDQDALLADGREAYANLGNTRSSLTPKKPQRTGSLRENKQPVQPSPYAVGVLQEDAGNNSPTFKVTTSASNVVYAAPNKNRAVSKGGPMANRSPTRALEVDQPDRFSSLSHRLPSSRNHSPSFKLGQRAKLEDTYGAVVSANYQALSQMLDRIREAPLLPGCDSLEDALARTTSSSVAWSDFRRDSKTQTVIIGDSKYFIPVLYDEGTKGTVLATLLPLLTGHSVAPPSRSQPAPLSFPFIPQPLVSFTEPLPSEGLPLRGDTVHLFLFPRLLVSPFPPSLSSSGRGETEGAGVKGGTTSPDEREACFQLLQMITALRSLHAQGYKEVSYSLDSFVSVRGEGETHWRLLLVQENDPERKRSDFGAESISLCSAACLALFRLIGWDTDEAITCVTNDEEMPSLSIMDAPEVFGVVTSLLSETGPLQTASSPASCLIKARGVLECHLWGPWVSPNATEEASEDNLEAGFQRWLDLERAQVLNTFVRNAGKGTRDVLEEYHLEFLVSATASSLMESWNLLHESAS
ncbi:unnamed protein product [Cyprideis torosa]|uniref:Uncharacterized protein n=1 Tax=Cyprideis torosa TaxID=163714 RepID=A0A7R8WAZ9_9CRUS|nr:unnamed protein product [Cyprideis torosa]CAG0890256.1 unnamed protein product [Cyprideis torosa]